MKGKLHTADWSTEANIKYYVGVEPRLAPPDPMDSDLGITGTGVVAFLIIAFMLALLCWGSTEPCVRP